MFIAYIILSILLTLYVNSTFYFIKKYKFLGENGSMLYYINLIEHILFIFLNIVTFNILYLYLTISDKTFHNFYKAFFKKKYRINDKVFIYDGNLQKVIEAKIIGFRTFNKSLSKNSDIDIMYYFDNNDNVPESLISNKKIEASSSDEYKRKLNALVLIEKRNNNIKDILK